ncbi:hypothetical protein ACKGJI_05770 [Sulfurospirillum sp. 1307]|jgi:hypothetical protein
MEKIEVTGSTVDFYKKEEEGSVIYTFDTSATQPPEPMVNAMCGLQLLNNKTDKLEMINHKPPMGLFPKIEADYDYEVVDIEDNKVKVIFTKKPDAKGTTDFTQNSCNG